MARHFSWSLTRTFLLAKRLNVYRQSLPHRYTSNMSAIPNFPPSEKINVDFDDVKNFKEFSEGSEWGYNNAVDVLMKVLAITNLSATKAIRQYKSFTSLSRKSITTNFEILRQVGICKSTIIDNKYLLAEETDVLTKKIKLIKKLDIDMNECTSLFNLSCGQLTRLNILAQLDATFLPHRNRILYMTERLQQSVSSICRFLSYNHHILFMAAPRLLSITEFLLESGIAPKHIMSDPVAYKYDFSVIKEKVDRARKAGVKPLKTWVIRCQESAMENAINKDGQQLEAVSPYNSMQELLCDVFKCSREDVDNLYLRNPPLATAGYKKLRAKAEFFSSEGYTIEDLWRTPVAVNRKYETLLRFAEMGRKCGVRLPIIAFAKSEEGFLHLLNKLVLHQKQLRDGT